MSPEECKEIVKKGFLESFNEGIYENFGDIFSPDAVSLDRAKSPEVSGPAGAQMLVENFRKAFPDIKIEIESQSFDDDKVFTQWSFVGTHKGDFLGKKATNKQVNVSACSIDRFENGKVVEYTTYRDDFAMMQQLGFV